jgi:hypothetical protein
MPRSNEALRRLTTIEANERPLIGEVLEPEPARCTECRRPADPDSTGPDGRTWCWGCYPYPGYTPEGAATEDVLVAPPTAKLVTPGAGEYADELCDECSHTGHDHLWAPAVGTVNPQAELFIYEHATCWAENICRLCSPELHARVLAMLPAGEAVAS